MDDDFNNVAREVETLTGKSIDATSSKTKYRYLYPYIFILITVFIVFLMARPEFLYKTENNKKIFGFYRLIITTCIVSFALIFLQYTYGFLDKWKFLMR